MKVRFTELPHLAEVLEVFGSLYYLYFIYLFELWVVSCFIDI